MKKVKIYTYLGTNGTITSPVHLEGIYSVIKYRLLPEEGYKLTNDGISYREVVEVEENDIPNWYEVKK